MQNPIGVFTIFPPQNNDLAATLTYLCSFSEVLFVNASSATTMSSDLANIAMVKNAGTTYKDGLRWLEMHLENWLLIYDNADDINLNLKPYFPRTNHGNIIITTRNQNARIHANPACSVDVSRMTLGDATSLLLTISGLNLEDKSVATNFVQASKLSNIMWKV